MVREDAVGVELESEPDRRNGKEVQEDVVRRRGRPATDNKRLTTGNQQPTSLERLSFSLRLKPPAMVHAVGHKE